MAINYDSMTVSKALKIISSALTSKGLTTEGKEQAMITAAGDLTAYCRSLADIDKLPQTYYETKSREGNIEYKTFPSVKNLPSLSKSVRESMSELGLSLESVCGGSSSFPNLITR